MAKSYIFSFLILFVFLAIFDTHLSYATTPAIFIFGDSTVDVGTNSFLPGSQARSDFPHNGIDFPRSRPTGRFSNGFNSADYLGKLFGFRRSPQPFLYLRTLKSGLQRRMFRGVNFASGGAGILDSTGQTQKVVPLSEQIKQFATVRSNLSAKMDPLATEAFLSKSIFSISVGSNDLFAYFETNSSKAPGVYIQDLMVKYECQIKDLYKLGARKFGIISVGPIGCCPSLRIHNETGGCLEVLNIFARAFHYSLYDLLYTVAKELNGMKYALGNTYEMTINVINNPQLFGFKKVETACCGTGRLNAEKGCLPTANLCSDRNEYLFWDGVHPTQRASKLAAEILYAGGTQFVTPMNFSQLAADY